MIVYNISTNTTIVPAFIVLTQPTYTNPAMLSWAGATSADIGTYTITLTATAGTGNYSLQYYEQNFNLYVAATGQCFVTPVPDWAITYRINSTDDYMMNEPSFNITCQNYAYISFSHTCTADDPGKSCAFFS
jgi:hypothetical protein